VTVYPDLLPTPVLLIAIHALLDVVERAAVRQDLRTFTDWHEHDGCITEGIAGTWDDLRSSVRDEQALCETGLQDDCVRRAWLAEDGSFYLRWRWYEAEPTSAWRPESEDPAESGDADLTAKGEIVRLALESLVDAGVPHANASARVLGVGAPIQADPAPDGPTDGRLLADESSGTPSARVAAPFRPEQN
jgi:hypothetical protein